MAVFCAGLCSAQSLAGYYRQGYFDSNDRGIYTLRTPLHPKGAVLVRLHATTSIERIYLVIEKQDLKDFVRAMDTVRRVFDAKSEAAEADFPPVSIMWRDRQKQKWFESGAVTFRPQIRDFSGKDYLCFLGDAGCYFQESLHSGYYYLMFGRGEEIARLLDVLSADYTAKLLQREELVRRPFEKVKNY